MNVIGVLTSVVCWESQGGGRVTGILLPLYDTAGATSLTFPALGCCVDQEHLSVRQGEIKSEDGGITLTSTTTSRAMACGWANVSAMLLMGPNGTLGETSTIRRTVICGVFKAHPSPSNSASQ